MKYWKILTRLERKHIQLPPMVVPGASTSFANCTELRKVYPNGVKEGHPAYETKFDKDKDGWGCKPFRNSHKKSMCSHEKK